MAKSSLLGLLAWALSMQLGGACLHCWPDAVVYFRYDAKLLLGDMVAAAKLGQLFLEDSDSSGAVYLEREHMEREAGALFLRLEQLIQRSGKDHERILKEAEEEKQKFIKQLEEAYKAFLREICSLSCGHSRFQPYEVAQCTSCRVIKASCNDAMVCAGPNVLAAVFVTLTLFLILGGVVWYRHHKKKMKGEAKEEGEATEEEAEDESSSKSTDTSEWSDDTVPSSPVYYNIPGPTRSSNPEPPIYENLRQSPKYENIPSLPKFVIPSPPELNIPSPPKSKISKKSQKYENILSSP